MSHIVSASNLYADPSVLRIVRRKLSEEFGVDPLTIRTAHASNLTELVKSKVHCEGATNAAVLRNFAAGEYSLLSDDPKKPQLPQFSVAGPRDLTIKKGSYQTDRAIVNNLDRINAAQPPLRSMGKPAPRVFLWREA